MKRIIVTLAAVASFAMAASFAYAGPAWEFTSAGNSYNNNTWDFASVFTVNSAVTASGLGYYADPINGQVASNPVALYKCDNGDCTSTGSLLASVIVDNTYALFGHFRYVTIAPITLDPGIYEVAGVSFGDNYTWNDPGFTTDPSISYATFQTRWQQLSTPNFLNFVNTAELESDGFWGPNVFLGEATFTHPPTVPEPSTFALIGLGLAGLGLARRKMKK